jgi:hypothetical protein
MLVNIQDLQSGTTLPASGLGMFAMMQIGQIALASGSSLKVLNIFALLHLAIPSNLQ